VVIRLITRGRTGRFAVGVAYLYQKLARENEKAPPKRGHSRIERVTVTLRLCAFAAPGQACRP
jgi:hypothetical protein